MEHSNIVEFSIFGDYALFSNPDTSVGGEKGSYPIPTYEALKGILKSVYWKPTIIWYIDKVRIMNPFDRTEEKGILTLKCSGGNDLAKYRYLKDCHYQVSAHFEWNKNHPELAADRDENKHYEIYLANFDKETSLWVNVESYNNYFFNVLYWMPIPKPPKE